MAFNFFKKGKKDDKADVGDRYFNLTIKEIVQETADAITIVFSQPENKINYKSGQFLTLIVPIEGKEVRRAYSLSSSPFTDDVLAVSIKRVEGGLMSNYLPDNVKAGDQVKVMEPMGVFTTDYSSENKRHLILFAGGSGITPMMSIVKSTLSQEPNSIVSLIYANRNIDSIIFKEELSKMETVDQGRLHVIHILDDAPMNWQGYSGLLNHDMLTSLFERIPSWDKTTYLMCGPEGMMNNVETLLKEKNIPNEIVFKESFVQGTINKSDDSASSDELQEREVTIIYDDEEHKISVAADTTILEAALDADIDLPYSCQSGLCTACRGRCTSGEVKLDEEEGLSEAEINDGYVLTCVGHPLTDNVVIEIG
jgi:ring-1,2-phenylacetyl-CoA epoxidase subunit PaaE